MAAYMPEKKKDTEELLEEDLPIAHRQRGPLFWIILGLLLMTGIFALVLVAIPRLGG